MGGELEVDPPVDRKLYKRLDNWITQNGEVPH
jgi:hypothetical protein